MPRGILITGPESSGKSTLALALSQEINGAYVPEYAREYLDARGGRYGLEDLNKIANGQLDYEEMAGRLSKEWIVCDTSLVNIKIWSMHKYDVVHPGIISRLKDLNYDAVFLCKPDFPWADDPLRENPDLGDFFFDRFKEELELLGWEYSIAEGSIQDRIAHCKQALKS